MKKLSFLFVFFAIAIFSFSISEPNLQEAIAHPGDGTVENSIADFGCPAHGHSCTLLPPVIIKK